MGVVEFEGMEWSPVHTPTTEGELVLDNLFCFNEDCFGLSGALGEERGMGSAKDLESDSNPGRPEAQLRHVNLTTRLSTLI